MHKLTIALLALTALVGCDRIESKENRKPTLSDNFIAESTIPVTEDDITIYGYERPTASSASSSWKKKVIKVTVGYHYASDNKCVPGAYGNGNSNCINDYVSVGRNSPFSHKIEIPILFNHFMRLRIIEVMDSNLATLTTLELDLKSDCELGGKSKEVCVNQIGGHNFYMSFFKAVIVTTKDGSAPVQILKGDAIPKELIY